MERGLIEMELCGKECDAALRMRVYGRLCRVKRDRVSNACLKDEAGRKGSSVVCHHVQGFRIPKSAWGVFPR